MARKQTGEMTSEYKRARDKARKREDQIAATERRHETALTERRQTGATRRRAMMEAGEGSRYQQRYGQTGVDTSGGSRYTKATGTKAKAAGGFTPLQTANMRRDIYAKLQPAWEEKTELGGWVNPKTGEPLASEEIRQNQEAEIADWMERYASGEEAMPSAAATAQPDSLQGRGRVITEGGKQYDFGGNSKITESMATQEMMGRANFSPRAAQIAATAESSNQPFLPDDEMWQAHRPAQMASQMAAPTATIAPPTNARRHSWEDWAATTPQQGFQRMGRSLSKYGLGTENWKATGRLYSGAAKKGWRTYTDLVGRALAGQRESRERLGR